MTDAAGTPGDDLREQLDAANREIERLTHEAAAETARLCGELQSANDAAADAATAASARVSALEQQIESGVERERASAARYRELALHAEPALPPELIAGDSIDAVDASLEAARTIAGRVRSQIEAEAQGVRVPAGAPPRSGPDLSAMTPGEKIRYGLAQQGG
jgi:hypothetical protein